MWVQELSGSLNAVSKLAHQCWNQDISLASAWVTNSFGNQKDLSVPCWCSTKVNGAAPINTGWPKAYIHWAHTAYIHRNYRYHLFSALSVFLIYEMEISVENCQINLPLYFRGGTVFSRRRMSCSASWNLKLGPRTFRKQKQLQKNSLMTAECWKKGKFQFCNDVTAGVADRELRIKLKNETSVA